MATRINVLQNAFEFGERQPRRAAPERVADALIARSLIPAAARIDALHVAIAALAGVQYLLTLNCRHIANASVLPGVYRLLGDLGLSGLLVCTPMEFLGGSSDA